MLTYRNRKTGAEFQSMCECRGEDWERITPGPVDKMRDIIAQTPIATSQPDKPKRPRKKKADE